MSHFIIDKILSTDIAPECGGPEAVRDAVFSLSVEVAEEAEALLLEAIRLKDVSSSGGAKLIYALDWLATRQASLSVQTVDFLGEVIADGSLEWQVREDACSALSWIMPYNLQLDNRCIIKNTLKGRLLKHAINISERATHLIEQSIRNFERAMSCSAKVKAGALNIARERLVDFLDPLTLNGKALRVMGYRDDDLSSLRDMLCYYSPESSHGNSVQIEDVSIVRMTSQAVGPMRIQGVIESIWITRGRKQSELLQTMVKSFVAFSPLQPRIKISI